MGRIHFDTSPKHRRYIAQFKIETPPGFAAAQRGGRNGAAKGVAVAAAKQVRGVTSMSSKPSAARARQGVKHQLLLFPLREHTGFWRSASMRVLSDDDIVVRTLLNVLDPSAKLLDACARKKLCRSSGAA